MLNRAILCWRSLDDGQKISWLLFPITFMFLGPVIIYGIVDAFLFPATTPFFKWIGVQWWALPVMVVLFLLTLAAIYYFVKIGIGKYRRQKQLHDQLDIMEKMGYEIVPSPLWAKIGIWTTLALSVFFSYIAFDDRLIVWIFGLFN